MSVSVNRARIKKVVGENVSAGNGLYLKDDGKWYKANASFEATMPAEALAVKSASADENCSMILIGTHVNAAWTWTIGGLLYVSTTAGLLTQERPSGTGKQVQIVGFALEATEIFFNPSYELVEAP